MSEQDRFDWNEDMNFESEADVQDEYDDFEDPLDGFSDYDEMSGYEDLSEDDAPAEDTGEVQDRSESEAAEVVTEGLAEKIPANKKVAAALKKQKRRRGISAVGLGFMFTVSILVAGVESAPDRPTAEFRRSSPEHSLHGHHGHCLPGPAGKLQDVQGRGRGQRTHPGRRGHAG
jgi:hypothetical protein